MARRSFRDRFFTPKVAEAMMSPLGIVLAGAGAAATILAGAPLLVAAGVGAAAWGARVLAAVGTNPARPQPQALSEPWRGYAQQAQDSKRRFDQIVAGVSAGPLHDRLATLSQRLDDGVDEAWRIAKRGHELVGALGQINTAGAAAELEELRSGGATPGVGPHGETIEALQAQLAAAERLEALATRSRDRLRLLDARFDELIARAVEVSVGGGDSDVLGNDVDQLVTELESLRLAMEETDQIAGLQSQPYTQTSPPSSPEP
jgi:hypothetical protein